MPRLLRTRQARQDALDIWTYIAADSPVAADKLLHKIDELLKLLSEQPGLGSPQDQYRAGLRCFPVGKYLIFYQRIDDGIQVIRILHGARNWRELI